jgi:hypothetical protein
MSIPFLHRPPRTAATLRHRGDRPLAGAASVPSLTNDEHVRCRSQRDGSLVAVGTDVALHYRPPGGAWRRIAWGDLTAANWSPQTRSVQLRVVQPDGRVERVELGADPTLAAFAADRIAHLRIISCRVALTPAVFGIVEAIRPSDNAAPVWRVRLDHPAHGHDPLVRKACLDVINELRSLTGC